MVWQHLGVTWEGYDLTYISIDWNTAVFFFCNVLAVLHNHVEQPQIGQKLVPDLMSFVVSSRLDDIISQRITKASTMPSSRGPQYRVADLDTPSTTNLLSPSGHPSVQAALVQGPRSVRATTSSTSLVGLFSFYSHSLLTGQFRTSLLILQQQVVEAPYPTQYPTRYSHELD